MSLYICCVLLAAITCGIVGIVNSNMVTKKDMGDILQGTSREYAQEIDITLAEIETAVNSLASITEETIDNINYFKSSDEAVDEYTEKLKKVALACANNADGALTYYITYNPELAYGTSGIFGTRNDTDSQFTLIEDRVNEALSYDTGYGFLVNSQNSIKCHPAAEYGTPLEDISSNL